MAVEITRTALRGLLIPDPRITKDSLWADESSFTQAGPRPGVPVAQNETEMVLQSSGSQSADGALRVQVTRPGHPGTVGVVWQEDGDTDWRGWNPPYIQHHWEPLSEWEDGSGIGAHVMASFDAHLATLPDDQVVAVWYDRYDDGVYFLDYYRVRTATRTVDGTWGSAQTIHSTLVAPTVTRSPCLLVLPSGRVLCFLWDEGASEAQVRMYYSDDAGANWTLGSRACLPSPVAAGDYAVGRLRVAYLDGQILMVAAVESLDTSLIQTGQWGQWASSDNGGNFSLVELVPESTEQDYVLFGAHDIVVQNGRFLILYATTDAYSTVSEYTIAYRSLSHAYQSFSAATATSIQDTTAATLTLTTAADRGGTGPGPGAYISDSDLAACVSTEGRIYLYTRRASSGLHECPVATSEDGVTWEWMGQSRTSVLWGDWWDAEDASCYPTSLAVCYQRSRVLLAHKHVSASAGYDDSVAVTYLGGWSTVPMPGFESSYSQSRRVCWDTHWLPYDVPSSLSHWSASTGGTYTEDTSGGYLSTTTTSGTTDYTATPVADIGEAVYYRARFKLNSTGSVTNNYVAIRLRLADGTDDYEGILRFSSTQMRLYDANGAATIDTVDVDTTGGIDVFVAMAEGNCQIWYRLAPDSSEDHEWTLGISTDALSDDTTTPNGSNLIQWGILSTSTEDVDWYEFAYVGGAGSAISGITLLSDGLTYPDDLYPGTLSGTPIHIADGVRIAATDGPAMEGDLWHIDTRYDYAWERMLTLASPRIGWRNTGDATSETFAFKLNNLPSSEESALGGSVIGFALYGINFRECLIQGYDVGTTSWQSLGTMHASDQRFESLDFTRHGSTVVPGSANDPSVYIHRNELMGGTFQPQGSGNTEQYEIIANTEGGWTTSTIKTATLMIDGVAGGATTSGAAAHIIHPAMVGLIYVPSGTTFSAYRLNITNQRTKDGYYQIGSIVVGPVMILGSENSWGRVTETSAGTEVVEAGDRTSRSRVLAPARRQATIHWTDGIDQSQVEPATEPDPDYVLATSSGSDPAASVADTAYALEGALRGLDGPHRPIVYLPYIPVESSAPAEQTVVRRSMHMLCRLSSPVRVEVIQGDEAQSEVVRVASVDLVEVV